MKLSKILIGLLFFTSTLSLLVIVLSTGASITGKVTQVSGTVDVLSIFILVMIIIILLVLFVDLVLFNRERNSPF